MPKTVARWDKGILSAVTKWDKGLWRQLPDGVKCSEYNCQVEYRDSEESLDVRIIGLSYWTRKAKSKNNSIDLLPILPWIVWQPVYRLFFYCQRILCLLLAFLPASSLYQQCAFFF
jgi:hypothetical protein